MYTTYGNNYENRGSGSKIFLFLLLIALFIGGSIFFLSLDNLLLFEESPHANEKHGTDAELVRNSCNNGGLKEEWINPKNGRIAKICKIENDLFGIRIMDENGVDEITAFVKNKMKSVDQVRNYLNNQGYIPK